MSHAKEELTVSTVLDRAKVYIDDSDIEAISLRAQDILATHLVDLRSGD